jgi:hypothetical protein
MPILLLLVVISLSPPADTGRGQTPLGSATVKNWKDCPWCDEKLTPIEARGRLLADNAEAYLLAARVSNVSKVLTLPGLQKRRDPIYVVTPKPIPMPAGPPEFRVIDKMEAAVERAKNSKRDVDFVTYPEDGMKRLGAEKVGVCFREEMWIVRWRREFANSPRKLSPPQVERSEAFCVEEEPHRLVFYLGALTQR